MIHKGTYIDTPHNSPWLIGFYMEITKHVPVLFFI